MYTKVAYTNRILPPFIQELGKRIIRKIKKGKGEKETENEQIKPDDGNITLLEWKDLEKVAEDLSCKINKSFKTDLIFITDTRLETFAHMLRLRLSDPALIRILVGMKASKKNYNHEEYPSGREVFLYYPCDTTDWEAFMPKQITKYKKKNALIVDDMTITGTFNKEIKTWLCKKGFKKNNVKTASIITTYASIADNQKPDFYWKAIKATEFIFLWGPSR